MEPDKKQTILFFNPELLVDFANKSFADGEKITGFREEILLGLFLLRWFKDGKRGDSDFYIGFKYKTGSEKEISEHTEEGTLSIEDFDKKYSESDTLSDIVIKSAYDNESDLQIHFQIKAFPRENKPETINEDLIALLDKKRLVTTNNEVLVIYSHYTIGLDHSRITKYLETYPYESVIQLFWTNKDTLNFFKLKPNTKQHHSLKIDEVFKT